MNYKKLLLHLLLCLQILTISLQASYPLKFVFLLPNILKKAVKTSVLWIPTFMGLSKMNEKIKEENIDYNETMLFVYPFDKENQQKLLPLKNEIKDSALKNMPDAYTSCKTPKALVEYVEHNRIKALKKLFGDQLNFDPAQPQGNINKSIKAVKINSDNTSNLEELETIIGMLKNAGYDTDAFHVDICNNKWITVPTLTPSIYINILTSGTAHKYNDLYYVTINKKYAQSLGILLHEINHILSGDLEYIEKYNTEKVPKIIEDFISECRNESPIRNKIKAAKDYRKNLLEATQCFLNFSQSTEYVADIKQIIINPHLTKTTKIEALTQYAEWMEDLLTYKAACQQKGQVSTDRIFNTTLALDAPYIPEQKDCLYDLSLSEGFTHPSDLSRYQLIMRAKKLLEEEEEEKEEKEENAL